MQQRTVFKVIYAFICDFTLSFNILRLNIKALPSGSWEWVHGYAQGGTGNARENIASVFVLSLSHMVHSHMLLNRHTLLVSQQSVWSWWNMVMPITSSIASPDLFQLRGWVELGWRRDCLYIAVTTNVGKLAGKWERIKMAGVCDWAPHLCQSSFTIFTFIESLEQFFEGATIIALW